MIRIHVGDALKNLNVMESNSVDIVVSSPPYNIGKEYEKRVAIDDYVEWIKPILAELVRVTKPGGSICWQVGNHITRREIPPTHLRFKTPKQTRAEVLPLDFLFYPLFQELGMIMRGRAIWHFGHGLHAKYRFSGRHETILWFTKGASDVGGFAIDEEMNSPWPITNVKSNHPEKLAHPCQLPEALVERLLINLSKPGDLVLDPFAGVGTVGAVAKRLGCRADLIELDPGYAAIAAERIAGVSLDLLRVA